jgi:hypothetical protein
MDSVLAINGVSKLVRDAFSVPFLPLKKVISAPTVLNFVLTVQMD